jgi:hypothetical protein
MKKGVCWVVSIFTCLDFLGAGEGAEERRERKKRDRSLIT